MQESETVFWNHHLSYITKYGCHIDAPLPGHKGHKAFLR